MGDQGSAGFRHGGYQDLHLTDIILSSTLVFGEDKTGHTFLGSTIVACAWKLALFEGGGGTFFGR